MVAITFIPNPSGLPLVNHKDGNKNNPLVSNLEWATHSENSLHSSRVLKHNVGENSVTAKLSRDDVDDIKILRTFGASQKALAEAWGVTQSNISRILGSKRWMFA